MVNGHDTCSPAPVVGSDDDLNLVQSIIRQVWPWRGEFLMAVIDLGVCCDESGIHDDSALCILTGYIASIGQWEQFDRRWTAVLKREDVFDFHSKDFFAVNADGKRVGKYRRWTDPSIKASFADWSDDRASNFIADLLAAIKNTGMTPLGAYVQRPVFESKPYFLLFDHCIAEAAQLTKAGKRTLFVFDLQKQYEGRAIQQFGETLAVFQHAGDPLAKRIAGLLFQERHEVIGLQAADLYTHCWYRHVVRPTDAGQRYDALGELTQRHQYTWWGSHSALDYEAGR